MDNSVDTLEEGILFGELSNDLSVVGQIGPGKVGVDIRLRRCGRDDVD